MPFPNLVAEECGDIHLFVPELARPQSRRVRQGEIPFPARESLEQQRIEALSTFYCMILLPHPHGEAY